MLAGENFFLVFAMAKRYAGGAVEWDDLVSIGSEAICRAAMAFDPGRGFKFSTLAYHFIKKAVDDAFRAARLPIRAGRLVQSSLDAGTRRERAVHELIPDPRAASPLDIAHAREAWERARRVLSPREHRVITGPIVDGAMLTEIAGELGVTKQRIDQIQRRALGRLRTRFARERRPSP